MNGDAPLPFVAVLDLIEQQQHFDPGNKGNTY